MFFEPCFSHLLLSLSFLTAAEIVRILRLIRSLLMLNSFFFIWSLRLNKSLRSGTKKPGPVAAVIFCSNLGPDSDLVSCNIWPSQLYSVTHDMLKNWPTPLLGPRVHCSYGRLSVELGCSVVSVSESDQEIFFTNQIAASFCSLKQFYLTLNPSSKL